MTTASTRATAAQHLIPFEYSTDGGATWQDAGPEGVTVVGVSRMQVRYLDKPIQQHSGKPASTGREVLNIEDKLIALNADADEFLADLDRDIARYAAPVAAPELDVEAERREFEAWFNTAQVRGVWEAWQASAARTAATSTPSPHLPVGAKEQK